MQISISAETIKQIRVYVDPLIWPFLLWIGKRALKTVKDALHEAITENVNRARSELIEHIDTKLEEHLKCDRQQFNALRRAMGLPEMPDPEPS